MKLPIRLQYIDGLGRSTTSVELRWRFCSMGDVVGWKARKLLFPIMSSSYFIWERWIPYLEWATYKPRKYLGEPRSFKENWWWL